MVRARAREGFEIGFEIVDVRHLAARLHPDVLVKRDHMVSVGVRLLVVQRDE